VIAFASVSSLETLLWPLVVGQFIDLPKECLPRNCGWVKVNLEKTMDKPLVLEM
jgi:hypothetical protein